MSKIAWALLFLALANVAVLLWPSKANVAPHVYNQQEELNPHFVRLNKEIEERFYRQSSEPVVVEEQEEEFETLSLPENMFVSNVVCYRLGPFMHQGSYELAQAVLFNADVSYQKTVRTAQESDVIRLFLGPYQSATEVADARVDLKQKRILDHFSRKLADGNYIISLGIYSSQETASSALRLFEGKLQGVQMQNETITLPDSFWLHFVLEPTSRKFEQLSGIDWGENSVKLGPHTCRT